MEVIMEKNLDGYRQPGLKDFSGKMLIGTRCDEKRDYPGNEDIRILTNEFNAVQATCYPKAGWLDSYTYDFTNFNKWVNWGVEHGKKVIMHMVTGPNDYFDDWIANRVWDRDELDAMFREYIKSMITSNDNGNKVYAWNIVNEAFRFDQTGLYMPDSNCFMNILGHEEDMSGLTGDDKINETHPVYIRKAFQYADAYAKGKLELRDYDIEFDTESKKNKALYQLLLHLRAKGVRVDALGLQGHLYFKEDDAHDFDKLPEVCNKFRSVGDLELFVTEADCGSYNDFELQKERYKKFIIACRKAEISQFYFWGFADNPAGKWREGQKCLIFDENFEKKPAYYGVLEGLQS